MDLAVSRIFLSHASANNAEAIALRDWLVAEGWSDLFLDLDPERGFKAGKRWQEALKKAAHQCELILPGVAGMGHLEVVPSRVSAHEEPKREPFPPPHSVDDGCRARCGQDRAGRPEHIRQSGQLSGQPPAQPRRQLSEFDSGCAPAATSPSNRLSTSAAQLASAGPGVSGVSTTSVAPSITQDSRPAPGPRGMLELSRLSARGLLSCSHGERGRSVLDRLPALAYQTRSAGHQARGLGCPRGQACVP
jgi:hypothetical protein